MINFEILEHIHTLVRFDYQHVRTKEELIMLRGFSANIGKSVTQGLVFFE